MKYTLLDLTLVKVSPFFSHPDMDLIPVRAFRFEPLHPTSAVMSLDAESAPYEPVQGQLVPQKARIKVTDER